MESPFLLDYFLKLEDFVPSVVQEFQLEQMQQLLRESNLAPGSEAGILRSVENLVCQIKSSYACQDDSDPQLCLLFTLFYDFPTDSAVFKFVTKSLKSLDESIIASLLTFTENVVLSRYMLLVGFESLSTAVVTILLDTLERIFDHLLILVQFSSPQSSFVGRTLRGLFNLHSRFNCSSYHDFFKQASDLFVKLSKFFLSLYKFLSFLLQHVWESPELIQEEIDCNDLVLCKNMVYDNLLSYNICFGVCVEALLVKIRLEYIICRKTDTSELDAVGLYLEVQNTLIQQIKICYDKLEERQCAINILTLAVYFMETERHLVQINYDSQIMNQLLEEFFEITNHLVNVYPDKQKSDYVYLIAFFYLNLTRLIHSTLVNSSNKMSSEQCERIETVTDTVISFAHLHWFNNSIEQLYEATKHCILIRRFLHQSSMFVKYLTTALYPQFFESNNSAAIYKLFGILFDAIGRELFATILMPHIVGPLTLSQSIGHFLCHSTLPALPSLDDPHSQNDFDFTLDFSQSVSAICQGSLRTVDFVRFLSIRFACITDEDIYQELLTLVKDQNAHCSFFFKSILPKLIQTQESRLVMQDPLRRLLREYSIWNFKPELFLTILYLNHRYNLDLLDQERKLVKSFIEQAALRHYDSDIWLQALALIIESKKSTEPIREDDTQLIHHFLLNGSRIQKASARDRMVTLFHKLFVRLQDSFKPNDGSMCQLYCHFVQRIIRTCFDSLSPNKYFGLLLTYLRIIKLGLVAYLVSNSLPKEKKKLSNEIIRFHETGGSQRLVCQEDLSLLMPMLQHSFDEIKFNAKELIIICYQQNWFNITQNHFRKIANLSETLLKSIRPNEAQTGVVMVRLLTCCLYPGSDGCLHKLDEMVKELNQRVESIEANILCSGDTSPTYPVLSVIRALLCEEIELALNDLGSQQWRDMLFRIIKNCKAACRAVASIVCNDSPEGHLPIDLSQITEELDYSSMPIKQMYVTSQKLLLNGWMTIKESVIILSHIAASFPSHQEWPEFCDSSQKVIDFLYENQLNLVHRGAFEQSSYAFNRLVGAVWKQNCPVCCSKIKNFLKDIENQLTKANQDVDSKYCTITRRSAGLPFVIQSILTSESVICLSTQSAGYCLIKSLIDLLLPNPGEKRHSWQVIHSLNILRALVRDARLTDRMASWIEPCIKATLLWFNPDTNCVLNYTPGCVYPIQNSSSMLFNAIITRIFGVKRNREDTSRKNRMSWRLFFESYPSLYLLLNRQLLNASTSASSTCSFIYPTLILLSRLTPTISDKNIHGFLEFSKPMLTIITNSRDIRLRHLTVRTYVQLLPLEMYSSVISELYESIFDQDGLFLPFVKANYRHGVFLLWAEMILQYSYQVQLQLGMKGDHLSDAFKLIYQTLSCYFQVDQYRREVGPIQQAMHLVHCRIKWQEILTGLFSSDMVNTLGTLLLSSNSHSIGSDGYYVYLLINFLVHSLQCTDEDRVIPFLKQLISLNESHLYEAKFVFWAFLNEILLIFHENPSRWLMRRHYRNQESVFMAQLSELMHIVCCLHEKNNLKLDLARLIASITFHIDLISRSAEITFLLQSESRNYCSTQWNILNEIFILLYNIRQLGIVRNLNVTIESVSKLTTRQLADQLDLGNIDETAHCSLVLLLAQCVVEMTQLDLPQWHRMVSHVELLVHKEDSVSRLTALHSLDLLLSKWLRDQFDLQLKTHRLVVKLFSALFTLLQDNESNVRRAASKVASALASIDIDQVETTPKFAVSYDLAIKSAAKLFVSSLRHSMYFPALMVELIVEHHPNSSYNHDNDEGDSVLFEKSELNIFKDPSLVVDSLIDQLTVQDGSWIEYLRSQLMLLKLETKTVDWIQDMLNQLDLVTSQISHQEAHIFTF